MAAIVVREDHQQTIGNLYKTTRWDWIYFALLSFGCKLKQSRHSQVSFRLLLSRAHHHARYLPALSISFRHVDTRRHHIYLKSINRSNKQRKNNFPIEIEESSYFALWTFERPTNRGKMWKSLNSNPSIGIRRKTSQINWKALSECSIFFSQIFIPLYLESFPPSPFQHRVAFDTRSRQWTPFSNQVSKEQSTEIYHFNIKHVRRVVVDEELESAARSHHRH